MSAPSSVQIKFPPDFSAIIVAGGRSSRLGGVPKASLSNGERTLLENTLEAVSQAQQRVVVGPSDLPVPADVSLCREDPPFSGPAAALTAGLQELKDPADWVCVLAVDMPRAVEAVAALLEAASSADAATAGFFGVTAGVEQPLAGIYRSDQLRRTFEADTAHKSVRRFLHQMNLEPVEFLPGVTDDVDTWDSAHDSGFDSPQWS